MSKLVYKIPFYIMITWLVFPTLIVAQQAGSSPLKVFILAGQSNMEGFGRVGSNPTEIGTLEWVVNTPSMKDSFPSLIDQNGDWVIEDQNGDWVVRDDAWAYYMREAAQVELVGGLTARMGFTNNTIGPEFGFGHVLAEYFENQLLIIKVAMGGRSLHTDFLPPSSAVYSVPQADQDTGYWYNEIIKDVNYVISNLSTLYPDYDGGGYEIAGFGWHQGWSDGDNDATAQAYEQNMINLINDLRKDLNAPNMPAVLGVTGLHGYDTDSLNARYTLLAHTVVPAQFAAADNFENVLAVDTRPYWRIWEESPSNAQYHWNNSGESYFLLGNAMGEAMKTLVAPTGISDDVYRSDIEMIVNISYPQIEIFVTGPGLHTLSIYDLEGKSLFVKNGEGNHHYMSEIKKSGLYIVKLKSSAHTYTYKVMFH